MTGFLLRLSQAIDRVNEKIGSVCSWFTGILVLLVCFDVFSRYAFNQTKTWVGELEWHIFALIFLFGAGFALKHDRHVRVDLFYDRFSPKDKALVNLVGGILFLMPFCLVVGISSFGYAMESFYIRETSPDPGGLPARYLIKFAVVVGIFFLFLQGISNIIKDFRIWKGLDTDVPEKEFHEIL